MNEKNPNEQTDISAIQEVDDLFDAGNPKPTALSAPLKQLQDELDPLQQEYDRLKASKEGPGLTELDRDMIDLEMKDLEAQMIPSSARIDRIRDYISGLKTQKNTQVEVARAEVEFAVRTRIEKERETLRSKVTTLADRTRNGLSPSAAPQTRKTYSPVEKTFTELSEANDEGEARKLAEKVIGELKPVLLAKISGFQDIKEDMLDAFVEAAKK